MTRKDDMTRPITLPPREEDDEAVLVLDEEITRPITLPPRPKCGKPEDSYCMFRDPADGSCAKRITTCRWKISLKKV
jgi:hypothetical protein